jgi:hypothetical protein
MKPALQVVTCALARGRIEAMNSMIARQFASEQDLMIVDGGGVSSIKSDHIISPDWSGQLLYLSNTIK